jgi:ribose transport system substrate-binding protein
MGARKAMTELADGKLTEFSSRIPITGCDGVPDTGQAWVRAGQMTATVILPATAGEAVSLMVSALQKGSTPPENTLINPEPFPSIELLRAK